MGAVRGGWGTGDAHGAVVGRGGAVDNGDTVCVYFGNLEFMAVARESMQGLLVFPLFGLFRLRDVLGQNDLLGNLIKSAPENPRSPEN